MWFISWFLRLLELTFEWSLAVDFLYAFFAIFWLLWLKKWPWCMIWMWAQLWLLSNCLTLTLSWLFLAALTFSFIFDPRLALVVLWTYVEFICFRLSIVLPRSYQFDWCLFVYIVLTFCFVGDSCNSSLALHSWPPMVDCLPISFDFDCWLVY